MRTRRRRARSARHDPARLCGLLSRQKCGGGRQETYGRPEVCPRVMPRSSSPPSIELSERNASLALGKTRTIASLLAPLPLVHLQESNSEIWTRAVWSWF